MQNITSAQHKRSQFNVMNDNAHCSLLLAINSTTVVSIADVRCYSISTPNTAAVLYGMFQRFVQMSFIITNVARNVNP